MWSLRLFKGYLITGDSKGDLSVWDPNHGTLVSKFKGLKADIMTLEVNDAYDCVYASGVDSRVLQIQLKKNKNNQGAEQWI
mmetsp:Transcript_27453/g.19825  ORF Transcript_27453/g.19825 Transcript_27453/m.19825 type:complete len:81 (+) Transcript_27453:714-956(+)